jgi:starch synthase
MSKTAAGVLHAVSEVVGFAKTGGLADVAGSLPRVLASRGYQCAVILPLYCCARHGPIPAAPTEHRFLVPVGDREVPGRLWRATLPGSEVPVYLVEQAELFERDDPAAGRGLYQYQDPASEKVDYPDNCQRFVFFSRAVLEALPLLDFWPAIIHAHDWQTGLVPVYLKELYVRQPPWAVRARYEKIRTVFSIHNMAYQGIFPAEMYPLTGLDDRLFNYEELEYFGQFNCLKAGIVFGDWLTTVSPTYAREIQTPYYGHGLHGVVRQHSQRLTGIVNGVDYDVWDPARDPHLASRYDSETVSQGKALCKAELQKHYRLPQQPRTPLLGMVSRLVDQKGVDLVVAAAPALLARDVQLVVLGEGNPLYHEQLRQLQARYPQRVGLTLGFDEPLAHQIEAGADIYLMPSQYEPSGLNQLYSLKYGTVPVVRRTGGLADTIVDVTPATLAAGTATGFAFVPYAEQALIETIERAVDCYRNQPMTWLQIQRRGMQQDWSWQRSAAEYEKIYERLREE